MIFLLADFIEALDVRPASVAAVVVSFPVAYFTAAHITLVLIPVAVFSRFYFWIFDPRDSFVF